MGLPDTVWERMRRGDYSQTDPAILEVVCSVGRQLAYRLEKLIDVLERAPEEPGLVPTTGPGVQYTPVGRMVELMRLQLASYPRDHAIKVVTNGGDLIISNLLPYSIPILITNQDNAQRLWYGSAPATINNAPLIEPEASLKIILSPSSDLYGIVSGANITVALSNLDLPTV